MKTTVRVFKEKPDKLEQFRFIERSMPEAPAVIVVSTASLY